MDRLRTSVSIIHYCIIHLVQYMSDKWKFYSVYIYFISQRVLINTGVHNANIVVPRIVNEIPVTKRMGVVPVIISNLLVND